MRSKLFWGKKMMVEFMIQMRRELATGGYRHQRTIFATLSLLELCVLKYIEIWQYMLNHNVRFGSTPETALLPHSRIIHPQLLAAPCLLLLTTVIIHLVLPQCKFNHCCSLYHTVVFVFTSLNLLANMFSKVLSSLFLKVRSYCI